jgi:hypothetical protein
VLANRSEVCESGPSPDLQNLPVRLEASLERELLAIAKNRQAVKKGRTGTLGAFLHRRWTLDLHRQCFCILCGHGSIPIPTGFACETERRFIFSSQIRHETSIPGLYRLACHQPPTSCTLAPRPTRFDFVPCCSRLHSKVGWNFCF